MGQSQSKRSSSSAPKEPAKKSERDSWRESWKGTLNPFGWTNAPASAEPTNNIFTPIDSDNILPQFPINLQHPLPRTSIEDDKDATIETNKFYANAFLNNQDQPIWTHPYHIWWGKGAGKAGTETYPTWGMNIANIEEGDLQYGPGDPAEYYFSPKRASLALSARELNQETTLTSDTIRPFSANLNLNARSGAEEPTITFPVVQGMSFVTGGYRNATPSIICGGQNGFQSISGPIPVGKSVKYRIADGDGRNWVVYINPVASIDYDAGHFSRIDDHTFVGPPGFKGTIQVAKNPLGKEGEDMYDKATGAFVCEATLTAETEGMNGSYSLTYTKIGNSPLMMFILPHHLQSLSPDLRSSVTKLQLRTTTKGTATAVWAERLTFVENNLPASMGLSPWTPAIGATRVRYPPSVVDFVKQVAEQDVKRAMQDAIPQDSMYFAGKALAKFATIIWVLKDVAQSDMVGDALAKLEMELDRYVQNVQQFPLYYDNTWKGLVSRAGFTDPGADFGNTYYNDHHFHYGYFVYTAATVSTLDPDWLKKGTNKAWVQTLVKDYSESDYKGRDYPFQRSFDWYMGHSWAKGLFESGDGKDEESTSEDGFASFAIKLWGKVIGDANMEKRGNLMLAVQARSFNNYFYLTSDNTNHPPRFRANKITGILFENKVDHSTYFGRDPWLISGIHMLPISPPSSFLRSKRFVAEEWNTFFSNDRAKAVPGGWRGILYANLAITDSKTAWDFFANGVDGKWDDSWIDSGASRSWYLVWCAALGGAPAR
ncbi:endo-1,3(4)-beta-glucanase 1 precursor [Lophiotrema nucula]|uniref:glucan endo-1,3-beta-D-glucosidase n=1 Tax=Lophiotrema nucula TaxID=690887 RepID=A0A6A5YU63_9PLEO|nr:endo-1,3(4)-beta-glucanase 1 precursor [Lophiotrema nucula]